MITKEELNHKIDDNPFLVLWEIIYQSIYRDIADGLLHPGDQISELQIARSLGVSRSPVKRALDELMTKGILVREGRKILVSGLTSSDYFALYEARSILEENAAYIAAKVISPKSISEMEACLSELKKAVDANDFLQYRKYEKEFHRIIIRATGNKYLISMYEDLGQDLAKYQFTLTIQTRPEDHSEHYLKNEYLKHKRIGDAIAKGMSLEARDATATDMKTMYRTICRLGL